ncbi:MAG: hypothetical protein GH144_11090 [Clostridia bacterium]|jgi:class 3 adenylate cyclase|nr:hypothetical protein [Clostridia bacterium]
MDSIFTELISEAKGRSEWTIVTFFDIRDFSRFSERVEAPNIALYLKKVFAKVIDDYFPDASFCKSTGDGLMILHAYDEDNLGKVLNQVMDSCIKLNQDFPNLIKDELIINFETPSSIGIGLTRGTACCLYSGDNIIDYSGKIVNLAARLTNLARPTGIVFDTSLGFDLLSEDKQKLFDMASVYIIGIAEQTPIDVYYLKDSVILPPESRKPISKQEWHTIVETNKYRDWLKLSTSSFRFTTAHRNISSENIYAEVKCPSRSEDGARIEGKSYCMNISNLCSVKVVADEEGIILNLPSLVKRIEQGIHKPLDDDKVLIEIKYQSSSYF